MHANWGKLIDLVSLDQTFVPELLIFLTGCDKKSFYSSQHPTPHSHFPEIQLIIKSWSILIPHLIHTVLKYNLLSSLGPSSSTLSLNTIYYQVLDHPHSIMNKMIQITNLHLSYWIYNMLLGSVMWLYIFDDCRYTFSLKVPHRKGVKN